MYELLMRCCTRVPPPHIAHQTSRPQGAMLQDRKCLFELLQPAASIHAGTPAVGNNRVIFAPVMTRYSP